MARCGRTDGRRPLFVRGLSLGTVIPDAYVPRHNPCRRPQNPARRPSGRDVTSIRTTSLRCLLANPSYSAVPLVCEPASRRSSRRVRATRAMHHGRLGAVLPPSTSLAASAGERAERVAVPLPHTARERDAPAHHDTSLADCSLLVPVAPWPEPDALSAGHQSTYFPIVSEVVVLRACIVRRVSVDPDLHAS